MDIFNRRTVLKAAGMTGLALATPMLARPASARIATITIASLFGDDKPETKIWLKIKDLVEERLPGRFRFNIVRNGALGGEKEVAEGVRLGSVHASLSTVSSLSGWVPDLQALDLPFLFRDAQHVQKTVQGPVGKDLAQKLAAQGFVVGDFINYGARHLLTKRPVTRPEQLEGLRIRIIQNKIHADLWTAFGMTPIGIPITETYNALATGVADAMDLTKSAYAGFKLYEVVPCMTQTGHIWASGVVYYAAGFWASLNDEQKSVFQEASKEGAAYFNRLVVEDEAAFVAVAANSGGQLIAPDDPEAWRRRARPVLDSFVDSAGYVRAIRDQVN